MAACVLEFLSKKLWALSGTLILSHNIVITHYIQLYVFKAKQNLKNIDILHWTSKISDLKRKHLCFSCSVEKMCNNTPSSLSFLRKYAFLKCLCAAMI